MPIYGRRRGRRIARGLRLAHVQPVPRAWSRCEQARAVVADERPSLTSVASAFRTPPVAATDDGRLAPELAGGHQAVRPAVLPGLRAAPSPTRAHDGPRRAAGRPVVYRGRAGRRRVRRVTRGSHASSARRSGVVVASRGVRPRGGCRLWPWDNPSSPIASLAPGGPDLRHQRSRALT